MMTMSVINASDSRNVWLYVGGAIDGSIFISTTSCFRLAASRSEMICKKAKNCAKKLPHSKPTYRTFINLIELIKIAS